VTVLATAVTVEGTAETPMHEQALENRTAPEHAEA
jgi:hypothetical protein